MQLLLTEPIVVETHDMDAVVLLTAIFVLQTTARYLLAVESANRLVLSVTKVCCNVSVSVLLRHLERCPYVSVKARK